MTKHASRPFHRKHVPNVIVFVMPWKKRLFYLVVTAAVMALALCNGKAADSEAVARWSSSPGSVQLRSANHESGAWTRHGSLNFKFDNSGIQKSPHVLNAKLKHMDPSVHCSDTAMSVKVKGFRAPRFLVNSGEGSLIPFSQMPSNCGFSVKRSRRDVQFVAPYRGCHVTQQGGNYVLPLHLWGSPLMMSCPSVLPLPSVTCFPSGMVLKISGFNANEVKVKVYGVWTSLSSVCSSCGFAIETFPGGLILFAPYDRGQCVETEGVEHFLTLLLEDVELLATCPSLVDNKPATTLPPSDSGKVGQYPKFPVYSHYPVLPGATPTAHTPLPTTMPPLPQHPQVLLGPANSENKPSPFYGFPYLSQYQHFPQAFQHPPMSPAQSTANKDMASLLAQLHLMQQPAQYSYQFPVFPQFPMVPGLFHTTAPPPPLTTTDTVATTPAPSVKYDGDPPVPQQSQLPVFPQHPFHPFRPPQGQTQSFHGHKPYHPQDYQIPVLYPPNYQQQSTAAPATTPTTIAATTVKPDRQNQFLDPYIYMPYYVHQQGVMPPFAIPPANPAPAKQHGQQPIYHVMPPLYPLSYQKQKVTVGG